MSGTVLITGANRGIGLAFCQLYKNRGFNVIAVCRQSSSMLDDLNVRVIDGIDVSSENALIKLRDSLKQTKIDIVINNAGILRSTSLSNLDAEAILEEFKVNALAPLKVVEALLDNLVTGSKVALITSRMGSIEDNSSGGSYGYRMSKTALNAAGKSLSIDLAPKGIAVVLLHPGYVKTEMVNFGGLISAEESVYGLSEIIDRLSLETTGTFWHTNGEALPW